MKPNGSFVAFHDATIPAAIRVRPAFSPWLHSLEDLYQSLTTLTRERMTVRTVDRTRRITTSGEVND